LWKVGAHTVSSEIPDYGCTPESFGVGFDNTANDIDLPAGDEWP